MDEPKKNRAGSDDSAAGSKGSENDYLGRLEEAVDRVIGALDGLVGRIERLDISSAEPIRSRSRAVHPFWGLVLVVIGLIWMNESWPDLSHFIPPFLLGLGVVLIIVYYVRR